jgi:hypothetical protein
MLNRKEILSIVIATVILTLAVSFFKGIETFLFVLLSVFLVLFINVLAKKVASFYMDSEIEIELWKVQRFGIRPGQHFKKPFPAGIFLPIIFSILSLGKLVWMAALTFDVKPKEYRAAKRHGLYSYSEMTESHIGYIAAAGIFVNLIFTFIGYLLGFSEFTRLSIYYVFFNMLPFSDLDGNKIFFGNIVLWSFLAALALIGLAYAFFLV